MKKQLNVNQIQSELRGGSAFFPGYQGGDSPPASIQETENASPVAGATSQMVPEADKDASQEGVTQEVVRVNARTPVRPNGKRIITRNSFEIYEDQMDALRKLSLQEKMDGKLGSMSQMVREAIDTYLQKKASGT